MRGVVTLGLLALSLGGCMANEDVEQSSAALPDAVEIAEVGYQTLHRYCDGGNAVYVTDAAGASGGVAVVENAAVCRVAPAEPATVAPQPR